VKAAGRGKKRLLKIRPCASRQDPDCDELLVVDAYEDNPEKPGTNPHPASCAHVSDLPLGMGYRLGVCHWKFRGRLRRRPRQCWPLRRLRWGRWTVIMEAYAKCPWGYVEPSLSVTVLVVVGAGWAGWSWVCRVAGVLSQPQAKDGKLAVQETHDASMSLGGMLSSTQKEVSG
jgi:hypothetical protein